MGKAKLRSVGDLGGQAAHPPEILSRLVRPRQVLLHALKKRVAGPAREEGSRHASTMSRVSPKSVWHAPGTPASLAPGSSACTLTAEPSLTGLTCTCLHVLDVFQGYVAGWSQGDQQLRVAVPHTLYPMGHGPVPQNAIPLLQEIGLLPVVCQDRPLQDQTTLLSLMRAGFCPSDFPEGEFEQYQFQLLWRQRRKKGSSQLAVFQMHDMALPLAHDLRFEVVFQQQVRQWHL